MDRNISEDVSYIIIIKSLSARRAWIEIFTNPGSTTLTFVALRKESVDRNFVPFDVIRPAIGRSPQGERG